MIKQYSAFSFFPMVAGVGIYTAVHILGRVSGTGNRHPIPMDRVLTVSSALNNLLAPKPTP